MRRYIKLCILADLPESTLAELIHDYGSIQHTTLSGFRVANTDCEQGPSTSEGYGVSIEPHKNSSVGQMIQAEERFRKPKVELGTEVDDVT